MVDKKLSRQELSRYARHLVLPEIGIKGQERIKQGKVLVVGAGGLGSPALMYLAAAGVGTIGIADFDKVEENNLQRQIIHTTKTVGAPTVFVVCIICLCKLFSSTLSKSAIPIVPTPAAARYINAGLPKPPAPTTRTLLRFIL